MTMSWLADRNATTTAAKRGHPRIDQRVGKAEPQDRQRQRRLDHQRPAAPPPEPRRDPRQRQPVDHRRPQEFEAVGKAHQREQPDRGQRHADIGEAQRQRRAGQRQRQSARKPHQQDRDEARLAVDRQRRPTIARCWPDPAGPARYLLAPRFPLDCRLAPDCALRHGDCCEAAAAASSASLFCARLSRAGNAIASAPTDNSPQRQTNGNEQAPDRRRRRDAAEPAGAGRRQRQDRLCHDVERPGRHHRQAHEGRRRPRLSMLGGKIGGLPAEIVYADDQFKPDVGRQVTDEIAEARQGRFPDRVYLVERAACRLSAGDPVRQNPDFGQCRPAPDRREPVRAEFLFGLVAERSDPGGDGQVHAGPEHERCLSDRAGLRRRAAI